MRELIDASEALSRRECPECRGFIFRPGPRGGLSQNMECVGCGRRYNFSFWQGQIILAHIIDNSGEWREDIFPKVLE